MRFQVDNEYHALAAVLVHRPGPEIERLTQDNAREYLFEDVPYLRRMRDEHDVFVGKMCEHGVQVIYLEALLKNLVEGEESRKKLIDAVCAADGVPAIAPELASLRRWSPAELVDILFAGMTLGEYAQAMGGGVAAGPSGGEGGEGGEDDVFLLPPIPNAYFSRDPAVVVGDAAISCKMHYAQRVRETLLVRAVLEQHPEFRDNEITYGGSREPTEDRPHTVEGGDVIVLSPEAVLVGVSERTRSETIKRVADKCFRFGGVRRVYEVAIPAERAFMHLDTVFTVVDRGKVLWYAEVMEQVKHVHRFEPLEKGGGARRVSESRSFSDVLRDEFGTELTTINTAGGRRPHAKKEQRMDAANALAIGPSLVVTYERNEHTVRELGRHGVECLVIGDAELVRGLGGPRCMTMPLTRTIPTNVAPRDSHL